MVTLAEQVANLEGRVADLEEQVKEERTHKHLMIDRQYEWRGAVAAKELECADLRRQLSALTGKRPIEYQVEYASRTATSEGS